LLYAVAVVKLCRSVPVPKVDDDDDDDISMNLVDLTTDVYARK